MSDLDGYLNAATRDNTRRSYRAAIEHFEVSWGGFLPATSDSVARYLVAHAGVLAVNTLKLRLSALAQWHTSQGFADPTKAPVVRKVLKGIRAVHPARERQAEPLQLTQLEQVIAALDIEAKQASERHDQPRLLRAKRDCVPPTPAQVQRVWLVPAAGQAVARRGLPTARREGRPGRRWGQSAPRRRPGRLRGPRRRPTGGFPSPALPRA